MRFATFQWQDRVGVGRVKEADGEVEMFDLSDDGHLDFVGVTALIGHTLPPVATTLSLEEVNLLAPVPHPRRNIFCIGKNYHEHAHEFANSGFDSSAAKGAVPEAPEIRRRFWWMR